MIKDAHVSYRLYRLYRRLVARALDSIPAAIGNRDSRAKTRARLELVTAIYGANLTQTETNKYGEMVRVRLYYGEDSRMLVRYMPIIMPEDPDMAFLVLAVIPFEQLARQSADGDGMRKVPRLLRRYGLWLATRPDNVDFVVSLCRVLIKYTHRRAVLDQLYRRPMRANGTPWPNGASATRPQVNGFKSELCELLELEDPDTIQQCRGGGGRGRERRPPQASPRRDFRVSPEFPRYGRVS